MCHRAWTHCRWEFAEYPAPGSPDNKLAFYSINVSVTPSSAAWVPSDSWRDVQVKSPAGGTSHQWHTIIVGPKGPITFPPVYMRVPMPPATPPSTMCDTCRCRHRWVPVWQGKQDTSLYASELWTVAVQRDLGLDVREQGDPEEPPRSIQEEVYAHYKA